MVSAAAIAWNKFYKGVFAEQLKPNQVKTFYLFGTPLDKGL
jgi:hypothetical protein